MFVLLLLCMQSAAKVFAYSPAVFLMPLALMALMLGLGVWGTIKAANDAADHERNIALTGVN